MASQPHDHRKATPPQTDDAVLPNKLRQVSPMDDSSTSVNANIDRWRTSQNGIMLIAKHLVDQNQSNPTQQCFEVWYSIVWYNSGWQTTIILASYYLGSSQ